MELNNPVLYRIDGRKDWITIAPFIQSYSRSPGGLFRRRAFAFCAFGIGRYPI